MPRDTQLYGIDKRLDHQPSAGWPVLSHQLPQAESSPIQEFARHEAASWRRSERARVAYQSQISRLCTSRVPAEVELFDAFREGFREQRQNSSYAFPNFGGRRDDHNRVFRSSCFADHARLSSDLGRRSWYPGLGR